MHDECLDVLACLLPRIADSSADYNPKHGKLSRESIHNLNAFALKGDGKAAGVRITHNQEHGPIVGWIKSAWCSRDPITKELSGWGWIKISNEIAQHAIQRGYLTECSVFGKESQFLKEPILWELSLEAPGRAMFRRAKLYKPVAYMPFTITPTSLIPFCDVRVTLDHATSDISKYYRQRAMDLSERVKNMRDSGYSQDDIANLAKNALKEEQQKNEKSIETLRAQLPDTLSDEDRNKIIQGQIASHQRDFETLQRTIDDALQKVGNNDGSADSTSGVEGTPSGSGQPNQEQRNLTNVFEGGQWDPSGKKMQLKDYEDDDTSGLGTASAIATAARDYFKTMGLSNPQATQLAFSGTAELMGKCKGFDTFNQATQQLASAKHANSATPSSAQPVQQRQQSTTRVFTSNTGPSDNGEPASKNHKSSASLLTEAARRTIKNFLPDTNSVQSAAKPLVGTPSPVICFYSV